MGKPLNRKLGFAFLAAVLAALLFAHKHASRLWAAQGGLGKRVLITQPVDESRLVTLRGNIRPEAKVPEYNRGRVEDDFPVDYMLLQLKRPPELEQAFEQYIDSLTDKSSPNFHQWLTAAQQGEQYGLAQKDIDTLSAWLMSHGFTIDQVYANTAVIAFSGTAGEVADAFHTEIHYLEVKGERHFANMSNFKIPVALAPAVVGVVSMNDLKADSMILPRTLYSFPGCAYNCYALAPGDFETIYNLVPLFRLGYMGQNQTIAIVEDSDTYSNDVSNYRATFGLVSPKYTGTVSTTHPGGCTDPGTNSADGEADLDAEVASAMAPDASIVMETCKDTSTFGGLIAIQNLLSGGSPPSILSMSYGVCEAVSGAAENNAFYSAFQSAAAMGVSVFVSAGDNGASGCTEAEGDADYSEYGIGVTGWGETPYNVTVGGTDFKDYYNATEPANGGLPESSYWLASNNPIQSSALSYMPEIPWNDSCASYLVYNFAGSSAPYGSSGYCSSTSVLSSAAGGGPSACATGGGGTNQSTDGEVDGSCTGYPKPSWQSGIFGNPSDGVRDVPDVSLFASNGIWGHYVIVCYSDTANGGSSCSGAPSTWAGFGGTSVAAPLMAGIQALVNQKNGTAWQGTSPRNGNPDPIYYQIAKAEFGASGNSACYSVNQPPRHGLASACTFYDITQGDTDIDCEYNGSSHSVGCYRPSGTYGVISTQSLTTGTVTAGGSGYGSGTSCAIGAPSNLSPYLNPSGGTIWAGGTPATCTVTISGGTVTAVTISAGGQGYAGGASCTITDGGGSGATCSFSPTLGTAASAYQPAYGATPGWDFATGIGSVNAYNLVFNSAW